MNDGTTKGLLGLMLGAALGAAAGILLAPAAGKDTRRKLANKMRDTRHDLDEMIEQGRAEWNKAKGRAADTATMTKDEVSDFVRFLFEEGRDL
ncbi:MAG: YtxH domain-containing protein, partial [Flavobacteriales bacterium]|nr:YtxH domain-containing protein [Flavobacteriales bacterium]